MTPMEILLLFAIAALVYQEVSWRDKARRIQTDYEKRISTEVAMAYETSLADDERPVRALTFQAEKQEPRGLFHEVTRHLFIAVTMNGAAVEYAAGDQAGASGVCDARAGDGGGAVRRAALANIDKLRRCSRGRRGEGATRATGRGVMLDRKSTRLNSSHR